MTQKRELEKKHRREQIINAAEDVVFNRGLEAVRMDEIAEKAGVSKGTLYLYFKNKTELALAIHQRGMTKLVRDIARELSKPGSGIELIQRMTTCFFEYTDSNPHYFSLFLYFETIDFELLREILDTDTMKRTDELGKEFHQYIVRAVQIGIQDGTIDDSLNPFEVSLHITAGVRGVVQTSRFLEEGLFVLSDFDAKNHSVKEMLDGFLKLLIRALKPQK